MRQKIFFKNILENLNLKNIQIDKNTHFFECAANTIITVFNSANYIEVGSHKNGSLTVNLLGGNYGRRSHHGHEHEDQRGFFDWFMSTNLEYWYPVSSCFSTSRLYSCSLYCLHEARLMEQAFNTCVWRDTPHSRRYW